MDIFKRTKEEQLEIEIAETYHRLDTLKAQQGTILKEVCVVKEVPQRKERSDLGKKRAKYDPSLPLRYRQYLGRANKKSLPFQLTVEEFNTMLKGACVYCGNIGKMSIDRINSNQGYTIDNVQSCCYTCNMMKHVLSNELFLKQVKKIYLFKIPR